MSAATSDSSMLVEGSGGAVPAASSAAMTVDASGTASPKRKRQRVDDEEKTSAVKDNGFGISTSFDTGSDIFRLLLKTKCEFFTPPNNVVFVCTREDRVVDVWKGMVKHNFLSVPVLQKTEHRYFGFVDLGDIVRHLLKRFDPNQKRAEPDFWAAIEEEKEFGHMTINEIMQYPLTLRNVFHPVRKGYSLLHATEILAREHDCHRIPVIGPDRQLLNMITQSQVVQFLHKNITAIGAKANKPLSECLSFFKVVLSVQEEDLAMTAFEKMVESDISGVAVVNNEGKLTGNLSLRDIKLVGYDVRLFWRFYQTVHNYVLKLRKEYQERHNRPRHVLSLVAENTLGHAIQQLAENGVHRIFIVDAEKKPIGVVTLRDILEEIIDV